MTSAEPSRLVLLIFDDLHIPFRSTARMRDMTRRLITRLMHPGDLWAIVTTGASSVSQNLTADQRAILASVRRVTGNRLPASELLARGGPAVAETRHRADVAYATAVAAIENLARLGNRPLVVLYFSGGYDREIVAEPTAVVAAAWRAQATIHSVYIQELTEQVPALPPGVSAAGWSAYEQVTIDSLRMLATRTGGVPIASNEELESALGQLLP